MIDLDALAADLTEAGVFFLRWPGKKDRIEINWDIRVDVYRTGEVICLGGLVTGQALVALDIIRRHIEGAR